MILLSDTQGFHQRLPPRLHAPSSLQQCGMLEAVGDIRLLPASRVRKASVL